MTLVLLLPTVFVFSQTAPEPEPFNGSVSYVIRYTGKYGNDVLATEPPTKMDMHIKDDNFIIHLSGGRIPRTHLFIGDSNHTYIVDAVNKRYFDHTYYMDTSSFVPVAHPTGETKVVENIECQEYKVVNKERREITLLYVSDLYRVDYNLYKDKDGAKTDFAIEGLEGRIPLLKIKKSEGLNIEMEMSSIKAHDLEIENFQIPADFKHKKRDPKM